MAYSVPIAAVRKIATSYATAVAITPTDNAQIGPFQALYIGVSGDVVLCPLGQSTVVTFKAVPVGILPVACQGVNATGTGATNLLGLG